MDFGMLPPEINSGRMYAGPGSGAMLAASAAWDGLAAELNSAAASYESVVTGLAAVWQGPSSTTMAAAVRPYAVWMSATAAQAEQTATRARAATAAYETAFAATVPPPVIAANRSVLTSLIATNMLGQNTPAIAATEAQYAEMWAQDAAAMYAYAAASAAAAQMTPFTLAPQTTKPDGVARQATTVAQAAGTPAQTMPELMAAVPQSLQALAAPTAAAVADPSSSTPLLDLLAFGFGPFNPMHIYAPLGSGYDLGVQSFLAPFNNYNMQVAYVDAVSKARSPIAGVGPEIRAVGPVGAAVSTGIGRSGVVGSLSVPQGWASAAPAIRPVAVVVPGTNIGAVPAALAADGEGSLFSNVALSALAGRGIAGTGGTVTRAVGDAGVSGGPATTATIIVIPED